MNTYWPLRLAIWRRVTWITALSAAIAGFSFFAVSKLGTSPPASSQASSAAVTPALGVSPLGPGVAALAASHPSEPVEVIVQFTPTTSAATERQLVSAVGGRITANLHVIHGLAVNLTAAGADHLGNDPSVHAVSLNVAVKSASNGNSSWNCGYGCNLQQPFNYSTDTVAAWSDWRYPSTGSGVGVAVIDTGIAGNLVDFQQSRTNSASRVVSSVTVDPAATTPNDEYGHGTHVAGLIAGNGLNRPYGDQLRGAFTGSAPQANLIDVKASDDQGNTTMLDLIEGLQFAIDNQQQYNIRVINLSVDSTVAQSYLTDPLDAAVEAAWNNGIVVVVAAGNLGTASNAVDFSPANDPYVITVGAVDDTQAKKPKFDQLTSWSSRGTTQDGFAKPEVVAPGDHMISTLAPNSVFAQECPQCVVDNGYFQVSGTSMAAGVVSGIAADVVGAHPNWTPAQVKGALIQTANPTSNGQALEVDTDDALHANDWGQLRPADQGLTPSTLLDSSGNLDTSAGFSRVSWSRVSWSRVSWSAADNWGCLSTCGSNYGGGASTSSADFSRVSWSRVSWSRVSWSSFMFGDNPGPSTGANANQNDLEGSNWDLKWHKLQKLQPAKPLPHQLPLPQFDKSGLKAG